MRKVALILSTLMLVSSTAFAQTTKPAATPTTPAKSMPAKMTAPVAVNTATAAQLSAIPDVGPKMAAAIIAARPFKNSADLIRRVKGIGPKNYVSLGLDKALTY